MNAHESIEADYEEDRARFEFYDLFPVAGMLVLLAYFATTFGR